MQIGYSKGPGYPGLFSFQEAESEIPFEYREVGTITMTEPGMLKIIRKVMRSVFTVLFFVFYLFSVAVVIMLLTGTLHLLNQELFPFKRFDFMTAIITISVIVVSIRVFPKMFKKYYYFLEKFTSGKFPW